MASNRLGVVVATVVIWGSVALLSIMQLRSLAQQPLSAPTPYPSYASGDFFLPPFESDADRMGYGKSSAHDTTVLNAGWYLDWGAVANPSHPGGAEYGRTIYFDVHDTGILCTYYKAPATTISQVTANITGTTLIQRVQAEPGALWMVGNEPDSIYNSSPIQPELYAELYHYFYTAIKAADPTAKVAIGAIVQPSPLRIEYLDKVLTHYQTTYGESMPVDVWNIHFYRLNEGPCGVTWGATVPPYSSSNYGWNVPFTASELLNVSKLESALRDFRQWMIDQGYGDKPLIITEFGVLPPPSYPGFDNNTAAKFLTDMFNMLLTATDPTTGLAADGNRLVQAWAWYSTRDTIFGYGGDLFNADGSLTVIGDAFVAQTAAHTSPYVDLSVAPAAGDALPGGYVSNVGNFTATNVTAQITLIDAFTGSISRTASYTIPQLSPRYQTAPVFVDWTDALVPPYVYTFTLVADPDHQQTKEINRANNTLQTTLVQIPDLMVDSMVASVEVNVGSGVITPLLTTITATIRNTGNWTSTETAFQLSMQHSISATLSYTQNYTVPVLAVEQRWQAVAQWPLSASGNYLITATINPMGVLGVEWDASNNQQTASMLAASHQIFLPLLLKN